MANNGVPNMNDSNTAVSTAVRDGTIYVAVEVSRSSWLVALHCPGTGGKVGVHTVKPSDTDALVQLIERARLGVGCEFLFRSALRS